MIDADVSMLLRRQNADGGWGAQDHLKSSTEATALALLALRGAGGAAPTGARERGIAWLASRQNADGSWPLNGDVPGGSWATSLAVVALAGGATHGIALRGAQWIVGQEGRRPDLLTTLRYRWFPASREIEIDPDLKGWPWTPDAFSWVEPTAYALLALKKLRPALVEEQVRARIVQGEALLYDRMCAGGGWNHGARREFGVDAPPYPEITALALVALQDRGREAATTRSLATLRTLLDETASRLALSWAILCLSLHGQDAGVFQRRLRERHSTSRVSTDTRTLALTVLAFTGNADAFRVPNRG